MFDAGPGEDHVPRFHRPLLGNGLACPLFQFFDYDRDLWMEIWNGLVASRCGTRFSFLMDYAWFVRATSLVFLRD